MSNDRASQEIRFTAMVTNTSTDPLNVPIVLAFSNLPTGITLVQDGTLPDGTPYVDLSTKVSGGILAPGAATSAHQVRLKYSGRVRFSPTMAVWGQPSVNVSASASPTSGPIPLTVVLSGTAQGNIVKYEWDFDGDGTYDWQSATTASTSHVYTTVGTYPAKVQVTDNMGTVATDTVSITAQANLEARPSATPTSGLAPLTVNFTTDGYDPVGTIEVFRWDFDGNGSWDTYDTVAQDYTHTYNTAGTHTATLYVQSSTGTTATADITITVNNNPPNVTADVTPSNGAVPLAVQMTGTATDPDGSIVLYEWDFDGDGTFDWSSPTAGDTSHTYTTEGTFSAVFRATDNAGLTATATAVTTAVRVGPAGSPTATAAATPTSGDAPLAVNFNGTGTDPDNDIVLYEWDFDGDGTYDWSSATTGTTSHTYTEAGEHVASLRVTDATGLTGIDPISIFVNLNTTLSIATNTVGFYSENASGMTASASSQYSSAYPPSNAIDGNPESFWVSADGDTPTQGVTPNIEVAFSTPQIVSQISLRGGSWWTLYGITKARIEVFNASGTVLHSLESDITGADATFPFSEIQDVTRCRITALAANASYPVVSLGEFDISHVPMPTSGGGGDPEPTGTNINTSINADTRVSIVIRDPAGNTVRTLVNDQPRTIGSYSDLWDCKDDSGFVVNDGLYYAILRYFFGGTWHELDLTETTGGTRYQFPIGGGCDQRDGSFAYEFNSFEDNLQELKFKLCNAQEVTAFMGPLWGGADQTRVRTIINRQPFPAGQSSIFWDGLDDQGNIAKDDNNLITGFWRYSLPHNAMLMTGGKPEITDVSAADNYFSPLSEKCDENGLDEGITLTFTLSEDVQQVELRVYSVTTSTLLRTVVVGPLGAGEHSIFWDGKNDNGESVDIGDYRLGAIATDADGNESMLRYTLVRFDY